MSDGSVGRNESPEKIKFLFLSNNRVSVSLRMHHWIFNQNVTREHFYSQANDEFMFIPSDTKNEEKIKIEKKKKLKTGKTVVDLTIMDNKIE